MPLSGCSFLNAGVRAGNRKWGQGTLAVSAGAVTGGGTAVFAEAGSSVSSQRR